MRSIFQDAFRRLAAEHSEGALHYYTRRTQNGKRKSK